MSYGPGVSQQRILDYLTDHRWGHLATICKNCDRTTYRSTLRAAHRLHEQGKIALIELRKGDTHRLIVCRPEEVEEFKFMRTVERARLAKAMAEGTLAWKQKIARLALRDVIQGLYRTVPGLEVTEAQRQDLERLRQACVPILQWIEHAPVEVDPSLL